jgi:hypothetical protein
LPSFAFQRQISRTQFSGLSFLLEGSLEPLRGNLGLPGAEAD